MRKQLRLSGSGGQGVITAAIIFAEAAVSEGFDAVQSQSYGPEARGGASKSEVIIDDGKIFHPHVHCPDVVLAMTQKAADKYFADLSTDGILLLDSDLVPNVPDVSNVVRIPITSQGLNFPHLVLVCSIILPMIGSLRASKTLAAAMIIDIAASWATLSCLVISI